jgi:hypothetical protein
MGKDDDRDRGSDGRKEAEGGGKEDPAARRRRQNDAERSALMTLAFFNRKLLGNSPHHPGERRDKVLIHNRL